MSTITLYRPSGFVIVFDVKTEFLSRYKIENVGGKIHNELWVPSEELEEFNKNIIGKIRITKAYFGTKFQYPDNKILKRIIQEYETKS